MNQRTESTSSSSTAASSSFRHFAQTTPFPNLLLDEIMPHLNDTQWRLLCVIVRQTMGWQLRKSGSRDRNQARKQWDWLSQDQLKRRTGRNSEALASAIHVLVNQDYIIARGADGRTLATPHERRCHRNRIYYSLSPTLLQRLQSRQGLHTHPAKHPDERSNTATSNEAQLDAPLCSVSQNDARIIEHTNPEKSNITKQTHTKEKETKSETESTAVAMPAPNPKKGYAASQAVRAFVQLFKDIAAQQNKDRPRLALSSTDWERLELLLQKQNGLDWKPVLQDFFASDRDYIRRHEYSLAAFLDTSYILLIQRPERRTLKGTRTGPVSHHRGWQRPLTVKTALSPGDDKVKGTS